MSELPGIAVVASSCGARSDLECVVATTYEH
jgi:hypothetical protein